MKLLTIYICNVKCDSRRLIKCAVRSVRSESPQSGQEHTRASTRISIASLVRNVQLCKCSAGGIMFWLWLVFVQCGTKVFGILCEWDHWVVYWNDKALARVVLGGDEQQHSSFQYIQLQMMGIHPGRNACQTNDSWGHCNWSSEGGKRELNWLSSAYE